MTEYLDADGDPTTNAVEDLVAMAGTDGYVNNSDFSNDLYLWFDQDTDGEADAGEMQALNFTGQGIDVSRFDDVIVTDTATGSIIAASSVPGVIEATYGANNLSLADAVVRDVFLPVDVPSVGASVLNMDADSILSGATYYEDNPDGFELAASLENPETGLSWKELFGLGADENYPDGTTFLLTVRAKTSGLHSTCPTVPASRASRQTHGWSRRGTVACPRRPVSLSRCSYRTTCPVRSR